MLDYGSFGLKVPFLPNMSFSMFRRMLLAQYAIWLPFFDTIFDLEDAILLEDVPEYGKNHNRHTIKYINEEENRT